MTYFDPVKPQNHLGVGSISELSKIRQKNRCPFEDISSKEAYSQLSLNSQTRRRLTPTHILSKRRYGSTGGKACQGEIVNRNCIPDSAKTWLPYRFRTFLDLWGGVESSFLRTVSGESG